MAWNTSRNSRASALLCSVSWIDHVGRTGRRAWQTAPSVVAYPPVAPQPAIHMAAISDRGARSFIGPSPCLKCIFGSLALGLGPACLVQRPSAPPVGSQRTEQGDDGGSEKAGDESDHSSQPMATPAPMQASTAIAATTATRRVAARRMLGIIGGNCA